METFSWSLRLLEHEDSVALYASSPYSTPVQAKLLFVVRIAGIIKMSPKPRRGPKSRNVLIICRCLLKLWKLGELKEGAPAAATQAAAQWRVPESPVPGKRDVVAEVTTKPRLGEQAYPEHVEARAAVRDIRLPVPQDGA